MLFKFYIKYCLYDLSMLLSIIFVNTCLIDLSECFPCLTCMTYEYIFETKFKSMFLTGKPKDSKYLRVLSIQYCNTLMNCVPIVIQTLSVIYFLAVCCRLYQSISVWWIFSICHAVSGLACTNRINNALLFVLIDNKI